MQQNLSAEDLEAVNRLLEWVSATRLTVTALGDGASVHIDVAENEGGWRATVWVHFGIECRRIATDRRLPSFMAAVTDLLGALPTPAEAATLERAPDSEPVHAIPARTLTPVEQLIA